MSCVARVRRKGLDEWSFAALYKRTSGLSPFCLESSETDRSAMGGLRRLIESKGICAIGFREDAPETQAKACAPRQSGTSTVHGLKNIAMPSRAHRCEGRRNKAIYRTRPEGRRPGKTQATYTVGDATRQRLTSSVAIDRLHHARLDGYAISRSCGPNPGAVLQAIEEITRLQGCWTLLADEGPVPHLFAAWCLYAIFVSTHFNIYTM